MCNCLVSQGTISVESTRNKSELAIIEAVDRSSLLLRNSFNHSSEQNSVDGKNRKSRPGHASIPKSTFFTQHSSLLPRRGQNLRPPDLRQNVMGRARDIWSMTEVNSDHRRGKRSNAAQRQYDIASAVTPVEEYYYFSPQFPLSAGEREFYPYGLLTPSSPFNNILHYKCQSESTSSADFKTLLSHAENNEYSPVSSGNVPQILPDKNQLIFTQSPTTSLGHNKCCNNHQSPHNDIYFSLQPLSVTPNTKGHVPQPPLTLSSDNRHQGSQHRSSSHNFKDIFDFKTPASQTNEKEYYGLQPPYPPQHIMKHYGFQPSFPPPNIKDHYRSQPSVPPPINKEYCCPQPPSPPPNIKEHYGPQPPFPSPNIKEYYGPQPLSPPPDVRKHYEPQPPAPPPSNKGYCCPQPPSPPSNIKEHYGLQPPAPPPSNKRYCCPQPPAPPPSNKGY